MTVVAALAVALLTVVVPVAYAEHRAPAANAGFAAATVPWLRTDGNRIVTAAGQPVTLRGANVLRSEWDLNMNAENLGVPILAGQWKGNIMTRGFASDPVNGGDAAYLAILDRHVALAEAHRMYVVFVWRSYDIDGAQPMMPDDRAQQALATLAERYRGRPNVLYGLQVEPHDVTWADVQPRFVAMVDAIRAASAPHEPIVMVPGMNWSRELSGAISAPVDRANVVYKAHPYSPRSRFQAEFLDAHDAGLPVFIGEFGPTQYSTMDDVTALLDIGAQRGIGWTAWCFDYQGGPALVTDNTTFAPTVPYGVAVRTAMLTTPALPT